MTAPLQHLPSKHTCAVDIPYGPLAGLRLNQEFHVTTNVTHIADNIAMSCAAI
jgi:hypothetical protein